MTAAAEVKSRPARRAPENRLDKGTVFRICRMLHTYLSAFAFMALLLFSATGVLLNHPEWFEDYEPAESTTQVTLTPAELANAAKAADSNRALAAAVSAHIPLRGAFSTADREGERALIRLDGPKGTSDIDVDLATGAAEVRLTKAGPLAAILDLHRGKNAGAAWRVVIDASAYVIMLLSLIGFVLFFSLRFRLRTSLILVGVGMAMLAAVGVWLVS